MFTGLVEAVEKVLSKEEIPGGCRLGFSHGFSGLSLGDSIAVNGACLTVIAFDERSWSADLSVETLEKTLLGQLQIGSAVNLERALPVGARLGGHMVTGHVDGLARIHALLPEGGMLKVGLTLPQDLAKFVAQKGSLTVNGVSLTINAVDGLQAELMLIPHTQEVTTLSELKVGAEVQVEVDLVARYVERLLQFR